MERDGFEVVRGVISPEEATTFGTEGLREREVRKHMAHSDTMWQLRTHPNVLSLFRRLWGCSEIVTGFDGFGVSHGDFVLPWHVDQTRPSASCVGIQGIMALSTHDASTGGLSLMVGSHRQHAAILENERYSEGEWEYHEVNIERLRGVGDTFTPRLSPGDVCVWDSRTVHRVVEGNGSRVRRVTAYLSFEPRSHVSDATALQRRNALEKGIATTHWASRFVDRGDPHDPPSRITPEMRAVV